MKLSGDLKKIKIHFDGHTFHIVQNVIDPCVFQIIHDKEQRVAGLLLIYVDDLILMAEPNLVRHVQGKFKEMFPVDEWEENNFEYVGCEYHCSADKIEITQKNYIGNRVEKVTIGGGHNDTDNASVEQVEENRTVIGCLSWLAKQTRPDIQFQVCQAQRKQRNPTIHDLKQTNKTVADALQFTECGITLRKIPEDNLCFIAFHDAAWGNTDPDHAGP